MAERFESTTELLVRGRFSWLLLVLVGYILVAGELADTSTGAVEGAIPMFFVLVAVTYAARGGRVRLIATAILNGSLLAAWLWMLWHPSTIMKLVVFTLLLCSLLLAVVVTIAFVMGAGVVGPDHLCGGICAYVLIAMAFGTVYTMQWVANPAAFTGMASPGSEQRPWAELMYFSFSTLSTVGYGDIAPATIRSRSVSIVEQLTGTFYVAVLIGRLAGLYPVRTTGEKQADNRKPTGG